MKYVLHIFILVLLTPKMSSANDTSQISIKLSVFELSSLSLPNISAGVEFDISSKNSLEFGGGYVYYSIDEAIPSSGYSAYGKFNNYYKIKKGRTKYGTGISVFYSKTQLHGNLLFNDNSFYYYKKTDFQKERVGLFVEHRIQKELKNDFFIELNAGIGFTHFSTSYDDPDVVQDDFRNGFVYGEVLNIPVPVLQFKVGLKI